MLTHVEPMGGLEIWTPTWINLTMGASTSTGWYIRLGGKWIVCEATLTLGAGFAFTGSGNLRCQLPVAAASSPMLPHAMQFDGRFIRPGAECRPLFFDGTGDGTNFPYPVAWQTSTTYAQWAYITSSIPMAWQSGDQLILHGRYLAAGVV